jgi:hypothetical protein
MCVEPTTALLIASVASSGLQYQQQATQQKAQYEAQKRQNELAKSNAVRRYATEQLRIRQVVDQTAQKEFEGTLKSREARARFINVSGERGVGLIGSTEALLADYYRTEANYKNSLNNNLNINVSQFERNLQAIQFGQESQSTYLTPPNPELTFATQALNVANTYYGLEFEKQQRGLQSNRDKQKQSDSVNLYG